MEIEEKDMQNYMHPYYSPDLVDKAKRQKLELIQNEKKSNSSAQTQTRAEDIRSSNSNAMQRSKDKNSSKFTVYPLPFLSSGAPKKCDIDGPDNALNQFRPRLDSAE